jgi:hypothetical protein
MRVGRTVIDEPSRGRPREEMEAGKYYQVSDGASRPAARGGSAR